MAEIWQCTNAEYHAAKDKLGATMLKEVLRSPAGYYGQFVADPPTIVKEQTPALILGSAVHCLVLEPENFDKLYCCRPNGIDGRTTEGKKALAAFHLSALGKTELTPDIRDKAKSMAAAVLAEPLVQEFLDGAIRERGVLWKENGLWCKCKPDILILRPDCDSDLLPDLKTTDDPSPAAWNSTSNWSPMFKWRYDLQLAHYAAGVEALTKKACMTGIIAVGNSAPYDVYIHNATQHRACGEAWRRRALALIAQCRESGIWRSPEQDRVNDLLEPTQHNYPPE